MAPATIGTLAADAKLRTKQIQRGHDLFSFGEALHLVEHARSDPLLSFMWVAFCRFLGKGRERRRVVPRVSPAGERGGLILDGTDRGRADIGDKIVDVDGQTLHGGDHCKCDQSKNQSIFGHVLTFSVFDQALHPIEHPQFEPPLLSFHMECAIPFPLTLPPWQRRARIVELLSPGKEAGGLGLSLASSGGQLGTDICVDSVDIGGQRLHGGNGCEGDQSNHQRVLDEVLTLFLHQKGLHLNLEL